MTRSSLLIISCLLALHCTAQRGNRSKPYYEDLSLLRPKVSVPLETVDTTKNNTHQTINITPVKTVNEKVDAVLDSISRFNLTRKFLDGYTIQIYSGQKKEDAMEAKKKMVTDVPDLISNLQYQQPKFRVTVGKYLTKLEAQKDLVRLKYHFPNAILIPEKILIK